ncbi:MAG: hypothetical protein ACKVS9_01980 [Phycisphaerae bacterium]
MCSQRFARGVLAVALAMSFVCAAAAQSGDKNEPRVNGYNAVIDNADLLIDNYARFMSRKYSLTDDQDGFTRQLLRERANAFLDSHESDLRDLFEQLFQVRAGGDISTDGIMGWAKRAGPLYEEAKKLIEQGNTDFREILNEDQKKIHDEDLKTMTESFSTTDQMLTRMSTGEMTVEEFRNPRTGRRPKRTTAPPPPPQIVESEPGANDHAAASGGGEQPGMVVSTDGPNGPQGATPQPMPGDSAKPQVAVPPQQEQPVGDPEAEKNGTDQQPPEQPVEHQPQPMDPGAQPPPEQPQHDPGQPQPDQPIRPDRSSKGRPQPGLGGKNFETEWEKYTKDFIAKYELNEEQRQKALTILKDCQDNATKVAVGKKTELEEIEKRENELKTSQDAGKSKELGELTKRRDAALKPIGDIFENQLKPRLDRLPTRAQRKAADDAAKKPATPTSKPAKDAAKPASAKPAGKPADKPGDKPTDKPGGKP